MTDKSTIGDDKEYLENPMRWVTLGCVPVKRRASDGGLPEVGIVIMKDWKSVPTVYLTNMFAPDLKNCEIEAFGSFEDLLSEGWEVD